MDADDNDFASNCSGRQGLRLSRRVCPNCSMVASYKGQCLDNQYVLKRLRKGMSGLNYHYSLFRPEHSNKLSKFVMTEWQDGFW